MLSLFSALPTILLASEFSSTLGDINLILKILVLLTIIAFVRQHVQHPILSIVIIAFIGWLVLFSNWAIFGSIYVLYILLGAGVTGVLVDFFFVLPTIKGQKQMELQEKAQKEQQEMEEQQAREQGEQVSGYEIMHRQHKMQHAQHRPRTPPPMG